jgi:hypothetical protein
VGGHIGQVDFLHAKDNLVPPSPHDGATPVLTP